MGEEAVKKKKKKHNPPPPLKLKEVMDGRGKQKPAGKEWGRRGWDGEEGGGVGRRGRRRDDGAKLKSEDKEREVVGVVGLAGKNHCFVLFRWACVRP